MENPFHGSYVALPTPFAGEQLDLDSLRSLIDEHAARATAGVVICGTTGEAATLDERERRTMIHASVEFAAGRLQVIAGVGTNATRTTVESARFAGACGVDGVLVVTPYYNRPSRRGLLAHFGAVADATGVPVILYNVPSRTGMDLRPDLAEDLARHCSNIVAIKEATDSPERIRELCSSQHLAVLCGEDRCLADFMQHGAVGAISVTGNVAPDAVAELIETAKPGGDASRAAELVEHLAPLIQDLFVEVNPVPVKSALAWLGRCRADVRGPLAALEDENRLQLEKTLADRQSLLLTRKVDEPM